ncbi:MAG TPA: DUF1343 domain-containing protein [Parachlamydiaceae bacterium]|nr:DUF1343 domain-containing protein [Parachlamydiaceae bacterium]
MAIKLLSFLLLFFSGCLFADSQVVVGADTLFSKEYKDFLFKKRIGLITNHTAINRNMKSTADLLKENAEKYGYQITAFFAPEHGLNGQNHASEYIADEKSDDGIPIYSLHGKTRRPTDEMLSQLDLLIYDIQDIGSRSYTYIATLFYAMEEASKHKIEVLVLDRPNPINGVTIDGPMLDEDLRSIVGYINVPYCHGMTIGELARFFNEEYKIGCKLNVAKMKGWNRKMSFQDTKLSWIPTSPNIPEATTAFYYPITGILGELQIVNIGIGHTLPFKVVGAPWINAKQFAKKLNDQKFPGVYFEPFYYKPFYGRFKNEPCEGVLIIVKDPLIYKPVSTQYLLIGILKGLYKEQFEAALESSKNRKEMFDKVNGTKEIYSIIKNESNIVWKLRSLQEDKRKAFTELRNKYLIAEYQ